MDSKVNQLRVGFKVTTEKRKVFFCKMWFLPYRRYKSTSTSSEFSFSRMRFLQFLYNIIWFMKSGRMSSRFFYKCSHLTNISGYKLFRIFNDIMSIKIIFDYQNKISKLVLMAIFYPQNILFCQRTIWNHYLLILQKFPQWGFEKLLIWIEIIDMV